MIDYKELINTALKAKDNAYVPYSNFRVGAALLTEDGVVIPGANIENASFGATCCAERTAIFSAIAGGEKRFKAIAIVSDMDNLTFPCGICRQVMAEFKIPVIIVGDTNGNYKEYKLEELLPHAFTELR